MGLGEVAWEGKVTILETMRSVMARAPRAPPKHPVNSKKNHDVKQQNETESRDHWALVRDIRSSLEDSVKQNKGKAPKRRAGWASPGEITPRSRLSVIGAALTFMSHETWRNISVNGNI